MLKGKTFAIISVVVGICMLGIALLLRSLPDIPKSVGGVCIGIGAGLLGMGISNLAMKHWESAQPEVARQNEIEFRDERNTMIRNRAKAKAGDIVQWCIIGIAYVTIFISAPLWVTLSVVGVFLLKYLLEMFFMNKYQKEL